MRLSAFLIACTVVLAACGDGDGSKAASTEQLQAWADELIGDIDKQCETFDILALPVTGWEGSPDVPEEYRDAVVGLALSKVDAYCAPTPSFEEPTPVGTVSADQLYEWAEEVAAQDDNRECPPPGQHILLLTWTGDPEVPEQYQGTVSDLAASIIESRCAQQTPR
jgi:hypothetical protein